MFSGRNLPFIRRIRNIHVMNAAEAFAGNGGTCVDADDADSRFMDFLDGLADMDGGLRSIEDALFDPANTEYDTTFLAVMFCAKRAGDITCNNQTQYLELVKRVALEHCNSACRSEAAGALTKTWQYNTLVEMHSREQISAVRTEVASGLVKLDALAAAHAPDAVGERVVDGMLKHMWSDGSDESSASAGWLGLAAANAERALGRASAVRAMHSILSNERTPKSYAAAAYWRMRMGCDKVFADDVRSLMVKELTNSIMGGKKTVDQATVLREVARHLDRY